jgi:hypothetical protein
MELQAIVHLPVEIETTGHQTVLLQDGLLMRAVASCWLSVLIIWLLVKERPTASIFEKLHGMCTNEAEEASNIHSPR